MKIINLPIDEIIPYERNPRKNDGAVEAVAASIREFGFKVPIVVDAQNVIVTGHTRHKAARKLGLTECPCIRADDLTPEQVRAYRLADNKVAELAEWDFDLLAVELEAIKDFDVEEWGFCGEDIDFMDFDGDGDGGGSIMSQGNKLRVVVGATMFDIPDTAHELYEKSKRINKEKLSSILIDGLKSEDIT